jgi:hypothetical protein
MTTASAEQSERIVMRPVRRANAEYSVREHLTETEVARLDLTARTTSRSK